MAMAPQPWFYWFLLRGRRVDWGWEGPASPPTERRKQTNKKPKGPPEVPQTSFYVPWVVQLVPSWPQLQRHHHGNLDRGHLLQLLTRKKRGYICCLHWQHGEERENGLNLLLSFRLARGPLIRTSGQRSYHYTHSLQHERWCFLTPTSFRGAPSSCLLFRQSEWGLSQH